MGNGITKESIADKFNENIDVSYNELPLFHKINKIAAKLILTPEFKELKNLHQKKQCDKLIVVSSNILKSKFSNLDINKMHDQVFYKQSDKSERDNTKLCNEISKFYIKLANLFFAIASTINPIYSYRENNVLIKKTLFEASGIPTRLPISISYNGSCNNKISRLSNNMTDDIINPSICNAHVTANNSQKSIQDENGIPELYSLYLDDGYNHTNGTFTKMSDNTRIEFNKNLLEFYNKFTGSVATRLPDNIKSFKDIKLTDFSKISACSNNILRKPVHKSDGNSDLFIEYAENLLSMIIYYQSKQDELIKILNDCFVLDDDDKSIVVNEELTNELLTKYSTKSRGIISELYNNCESKYNNGLVIYKTIIDKKILDTTKKQIENLYKEKDILLYK